MRAFLLVASSDEVFTCMEVEEWGRYLLEHKTFVLSVNVMVFPCVIKSTQYFHGGIINKLVRVILIVSVAQSCFILYENLLLELIKSSQPSECSRTDMLISLKPWNWKCPAKVQRRYKQPSSVYLDSIRCK